MASVNKCFIVGRIGSEIELRRTGSGKAVTTLSVATSKSVGKGDDRREQTVWHRINVWEAAAENCAKYLSKGKLVHVEGEITTRDWEDKDGVKRTSVEILAHRVTFLSPKDEGARRRADDDVPPADDDSELPF